jgi:hypothetical protein
MKQRSQGRLIRRNAIILLSAITACVALLPIPAALAAPSPHPSAGTKVVVRHKDGTVTVQQTVGIDKTTAEKLSTIKARRVANSGTSSPAETPPPGCNWDGDHLNLWMSWSYNPFGELSLTDAQMQGDVTCDALSPDETMDYLADIVRIYDNHQEKAHGILGQCSFSVPDDPPCLVAGSSGVYDCLGVAGCAGNYQAIHYPEMLLPPGWEWTSYPSDLCEVIGSQNRDLFCYIGTGVITVPPTSAGL